MPPRLLVLPIFAEEQWPSIHFCAEMLVDQLQRHQSHITTSVIECRFSSRFGRLPGLHGSRFGRNADRFINRFWDYSQRLKMLRSEYDVFHVCDHSYSQLIHELPAERAGVLCQDLDTFRCLLDPASDPRPWWFKRMTQRILDGFQRAAVVFYTTGHVREQIERHRLVESSRLVHAPLGIAPEFAELARSSKSNVEQDNNPPYLLHVGSCISRKRIDVLLRIVAGIRRRSPDVTLIKIGGEFTSEQRTLILELGLADAVQHRTGISRTELANLYRGSLATLVTSEREGFGLPVIEALACGSAVIANDIPPLREGGGDATIYRSIDEIDAWVETLVMLRDKASLAPPIEQRRAQALRFTWEAHADAVASAYQRLATGVTARV